MSDFGALSGTPTATGTFTFSVTADTGIASVSGASHTVTVGEAPTFVSGTPLSGTVGTPYSHIFAVAGSPPSSFSIAAGGLPDGLRLDATSGALSGTPTTSGQATFTVQADNGFGEPATLHITLQIDPAVEPTPTPHAPTDGRPHSGEYPAAWQQSAPGHPPLPEVDDPSDGIADTGFALGGSLLLPAVGILAAGLVLAVGARARRRARRDR